MTSDNGASVENEFHRGKLALLAQLQTLANRKHTIDFCGNNHAAIYRDHRPMNCNLMTRVEFLASFEELIALLDDQEEWR